MTMYVGENSLPWYFWISTHGHKKFMLKFSYASFRHGEYAQKWIEIYMPYSTLEFGVVKRPRDDE